MASPWYEKGLQFTCTGCGNCCTGDPGFTWIDQEEITALAHRLGMDEGAFRQRYTIRVYRNGSELTSLREQQGGDCVFYRRGTGCSVYEDRPRQCRTWPFWRRVTMSPESWAVEAVNCPGMNRGKAYSCRQIQEILADDGLPS